MGASGNADFALLQGVENFRSADYVGYMSRILFGNEQGDEITISRNALYRTGYQGYEAYIVNDLFSVPLLRTVHYGQLLAGAVSANR